MLGNSVSKQLRVGHVLPQPGRWSFLPAPPLQNVPIARAPSSRHPVSLGVVIKEEGKKKSQCQGMGVSRELGVSPRQLIASHAHFPMAQSKPKPSLYVDDALL